MARASDNVFPKVIVAEGAAPSSPAAGQHKLYVDSADHKLKRKDSSGTVVNLEASTLTVQDENSNVSTAVTQIDFQGAGVTATAGTGEVVVTIPGGSGSSYPAGSADAPPGSPNAKDDEYDGASSVTWTATPTAANARDRNSTRAGHLYIKAASGNASHLVGEYQAIPASFPFTVTTKVVSTTCRQAFHRGGGLYFAPASPTTSSAVVYFGSVYNSASPVGVEIVRIAYTNDSTFGSQSTFIGQRAGLPVREYYLKAVFTSATAASLYYSTDGYAWILAEAYTFGFTVANMGVAQSEETANTGVEAFYGFFRVS